MNRSFSVRHSVMLSAYGISLAVQAIVSIRAKTTNLFAFLTLRWGPTPSACQRSLLRSRRLIATMFRLVDYLPRSLAAVPSTPFGGCSFANWSSSFIAFFSLSSSAFNDAVMVS